MKKILSLIAIITLSLSLIACEGTPEETVDLNDDSSVASMLSSLQSEIEAISLEIEAINEALEGLKSTPSDVSDLSAQFVSITSELNTLINSYTSMALAITLLQPEDIVLEDLSYASYLNESNPEVTIVVKNLGTMTLQLFPDVAPNSVRNMIKLIEEGFYDGLIFHRVIEGFMIQGGWASLMGKQDSSCVLEGEFLSNGIANPLNHDRGVLSMARTTVRNSATSQFFIMHQKVTSLDGQYAAFGGLTSGFNVLDVIASTPTNQDGRPLSNIVIESVTVDLKGVTYPGPVCIN
jgi:peptidyl-prolyl cis-trans isomerase B (cyclophilin B)